MEKIVELPSVTSSRSHLVQFGFSCSSQKPYSYYGGTLPYKLIFLNRMIKNLRRDRDEI